LDPFYQSVANFLNNYSVGEFPLFALNFDYMRTLTSLIQEKIVRYLKTYEKIMEIVNLFQSKINKARESENTKSRGTSRDTQKKNTKYFPNKKKDSFTFSFANYDSNSSSPERREVSKENECENDTKNLDNNLESIAISNKKMNENKISIKDAFTSIINNSVGKGIIEKMKIKKENILNLKNKYQKILISFYFRKLIKFDFNKKVLFMFTSLDKIDLRNIFYLKRRFFLFLISNLIKMKNMDNYLKQKKRNFIFKIHAALFEYMRKNYIAKKFRRRIQLSKIFYKMIEETSLSKIYKNKISHGKLFYYNNLIRKAFTVLKYNLHISDRILNNFKKEGKNSLGKEEIRQEDEINSRYSQVYDFFHSGSNFEGSSKGNNEDRKGEFLNKINSLSDYVGSEANSPKGKTERRGMRDIDDSLEKSYRNKYLGKTNMMEHKFQQNMVESKNNSIVNCNYMDEDEVFLDQKENELDTLINKVKNKFKEVEKSKNFYF